MNSPYWLLAGVLLAGSVQAVPHYGPPVGSGMGPGMGAGPAAGLVPGPQMRGRPDGPRMTNPAHALRTGMDRLLAFVGRDPRPSKPELVAFLKSEVAPLFDFDYMAESAGGRLYERLDAASKQAMVTDIKRTFLTKMAEKLGAYKDQRVRFLPPRGSGDGRTAQVSVAILNPGSYPGRLDFRLYRAGDKWRVYDVAANGQSAIVHYRRQLMRELQQQRMQQVRNPVPPMRRAMPPAPYERPPVR